MIKLLDTHQHLVYRDVAGYSWAKDIPPLAEDNFTVEDYLKLTESQGIGGTLFMETGVDDPDYQSEAKYVQSLAEDANNNIKGLIVSFRPERAMIVRDDYMVNKFIGKIVDVIYDGDHTRVRLDLLGNKEFILKVPNSSARMDIKLGNEIKKQISTIRNKA